MKVDEVLHRMKNLQRFEVELEVPEEFNFDGPVPFDMRIANGQASCKVWAVSAEEAHQRAWDYFNPYDYGRS
jgi:hypothetical protein